MNDEFTPYEEGLERLLNDVGNEHERYAEALLLQARLRENIDQARRYGDTSDGKSDRMQILASLDRLALNELNRDFTHSYVSPSRSTEIPKPGRSAFGLAQAGDALAEVLAGRTDYIEQILASDLKEVIEPRKFAHSLVTSGIDSADPVPSPPVLYAPREELIQKLCEDLRDLTWLAVVGGPGEGKTQIVAAVTRAYHAKHVRWISLRRYGTGLAHLHLGQQMARWFVDLTESTELGDLYATGRIDFGLVAELICGAVGEHGLLVVDNLPDPLQDELVFEQLAIVSGAFAKTNAKLLTTSQRTIPPHIRDRSESVSILKAPPFELQDVRQMLESAGAPEEIGNERFLGFILGLTTGHPALVSAVIYWLKRRHWRLREGDLTALLQGEPVEDVREYERRRLLRLADVRSRELLYRLSLMKGDFDRELVLKVAAISPSVRHPGESLDELFGPWVDRLGRDRYEVSPLLKDTGQTNLSEETQRTVHRAAADHYLSRRVLDMSLASNVALHLLEARDYQRFASFVTHALMAAKSPEQAEYLHWMTLIFSPDATWPAELDLDLRIMLRAAQVRTRALAGSNVDALDSDLEDLIAEAGTGETHAVLFAYLNTGPFANQIPAETALKRAIGAVRLLRSTSIIPQDVFSADLEEMIWFPTVRLNSISQIRRFLDEVRRMDDMERQRLFDTGLAVESTAHLIDRSWMNEASKPVGQQNWDGVLGLLDEVQETGCLLGAEVLRGAETRARAVVLADYLARPEAALQELASVSEVEDPDLAFLLLYTRACILFDSDQNENALRYLDAASDTGGNAFAYYRFDAKRRAAIVQAKLEKWDAAKRCCIAAIQTARKMAAVSDYDRWEMMGELAWIHWATEERKRACGALYGYATGLVATEDIANPRFRQAFNKVGHALGWFLMQAALERPSAVTATGEPYTPVEAGLFGVQRIQLGDYVPPLGFSRSLLLTLLAMLCEALGCARLAWKAHNLAVSFSSEEDSDMMLALGEMGLASLAVRFGDPTEALDIGLHAVRATCVAAKLQGNNAGILNQSISPEDIWDSIPRQDRADAERKLLYVVLAPAFGEILRADLEVDKALEKLSVWEDALSSQEQALEEPTFWRTVVQVLKRLVLIWSGRRVSKEDLDIPDDTPVLDVLWRLAASNQPETSLRDSFRMQVEAVDFLIRGGTLTRYIMPGVGRFIHRFWAHIADTRGFALNSPRLLREELDRISPRQGAATAVAVLRSAGRGLGVSLPDTILETFERIEGA